MTTAVSPELSVILLSPDSLETQRTTVRHLRNQTIRDRIEVVIVCPTEAGREVMEREMCDFHSYQFVRSPHEAHLPKQQALGAQHARAEFIAYGEDHCAPHPRWAEKLLEAFRRPEKYAGIAVAMHNANPGSMLSWGNLSFGYLNWIAPVPAGVVNYIPGTNGTYRKEILLSLGDDLAATLERGGNVHDRIRAMGHRFYQEPEAKVYHKNPSLWRSTWRLRTNSGRWIASQEAKKKNMGAPMRFIRALFTGFDGAYLWLKVIKRLTARKYPITLKIVLGVGVCCTLEAIGRTIGYIAGAGNAREVLYALEFHRDQHMRPQERNRNAVLENNPQYSTPDYIDPLALPGAAATTSSPAVPLAPASA